MLQQIRKKNQTKNVNMLSLTTNKISRSMEKPAKRVSSKKQKSIDFKHFKDRKNYKFFKTRNSLYKSNSNSRNHDRSKTKQSKRCEITINNALKDLSPIFMNPNSNGTCSTNVNVNVNTTANANGNGNSNSNNENVHLNSSQAIKDYKTSINSQSIYCIDMKQKVQINVNILK